MMKSGHLPSIAAILAAASVTVASSSAEAQNATHSGLALNRFSPAPAGDRMFGVPSPFTAGDGLTHAMLVGDYAHAPLVIFRETDDGEEELGAVVEHQLFAHLNVTGAMWNRFHFNIDLPVALVQDGEDPTADGQTFTSPSEAQLGDLRLGARVRLYGEYDDVFQLGVGTYVWLPTGQDGAYVSTGEVRAQPQILVGGRHDRFVYSVMLGPQIRSSQTFTNVEQGTTLEAGAGVGVLLGKDRQWQVGPELTTALTLEDVEDRTTNAELLLDARYRFLESFEAGVGAGPGLASGVGTPDFRAVAMIAYSPVPRTGPEDRDTDGVPDERDACPDTPGVASLDPAKNGCPPPSDRDRDGFFDDVDACPETPGVPSDDPAKHGCPPPPDRDGDGFVDSEDACVDVPGVASHDPSKHGCPLPLDRDFDGIVDTQDACPDVVGVATTDPKTHGCADSDGDTIFDPVDACPNEKGGPNQDPAKHGCPTVRVTATEIVILQKVQFDHAKSTIKAESDSLLAEVAAALNAHPEILLVEVQGHTDAEGSDAYNRRLSNDRAKAVKRALQKRGIDAGRLTAKGYGEAEPIAPNDTDEGREKNRRVQFKIIKKAAPTPPPPAAPAAPPPAATPATPPATP